MEMVVGAPPRGVRMVLGTAQLGMTYGITNRTGKPSRTLARAIVEFAVKRHLDLDTAAAYGDAEEILGQVHWSPEFTTAYWSTEVTTKIHPCLFDSHAEPAPPDYYIGRVLEAVRGSTGRLSHPAYQSPRKPAAVLVHRAPDMAKVLPGLFVARSMGLTTRVGVSIYTEAEFREALQAQVDVIQMPYHALDRRAEQWAPEAVQAGVAVDLRSPYCQGLLTLRQTHVVGFPDMPIPRSAWPTTWTALSKFWSACATQTDRRPITHFPPRWHALNLATALAESLDTDAVPVRVVVGVETLAQARETFGEVAPGPLPDRQAAMALREALGSVGWDEAVVTPSLWARP